MDAAENPTVDREIGGKKSSSERNLSNKNEVNDHLQISRQGNEILVGELEGLRASYQNLEAKSSAIEGEFSVIKTEREEKSKRRIRRAKTIDVITWEKDALREELDGVRANELSLVSEHEEMKNRLFVIEKEKNEALKQKVEVVKRIEDVRDSFKESEDKILNKLDAEARKNKELQVETEVCRRRIKELEDENIKLTGIFEKVSDSILSTKESTMRVISSVDEERMGIADFDDTTATLGETFEFNEGPKVFSDVLVLSNLATIMEEKVRKYQVMRKKEKKELESSVVSLTEENRDINSLLRIALVEKEEIEKSLNKLKGNNENKRVALLQFAERGLQKVGFGFMMGSVISEQSLENVSDSASNKSNSSDCDEEVVSLASAVEKIMKNLRLEITQLRSSLEESRSDNERLQSLTENQARKIADNTVYTKALEDRENVLTQNIEDLLMEMEETKEEVARWREACELEVQAGKNVIEECEKRAAILQQELEKTRASLHISNGKLKLKEDVAAAAMGAQAAAERSLRLADSRAAELRERVEELTRQLEELDRRERKRHRVRHMCWPWRILTGGHNNRMHDVKRMLPEMQALLHHTL